jgi:hypothetical protein
MAKKPVPRVRVLPIEPPVADDINRFAHSPSSHADLCQRITELEARHRALHMTALVTFDLQPGTYGATITVWDASRRRQMQIYGAASAERILKCVETWCATNLDAWLEQERDYELAQAKQAGRLRLTTPQAVADDAYPLWLAAGRMVKDLTGPGSLPTPKPVLQWLHKHRRVPVSDESFNSLNRAHLLGSVGWVHLARSKNDVVHREKVK